jgi:hypothetical protein
MVKLSYICARSTFAVIMTIVASKDIGQVVVAPIQLSRTEYGHLICTGMILTSFEIMIIRKKAARVETPKIILQHGSYYLNTTL